MHFLRLHLVGKKIASASAIDDGNVFGKVGTSGAAVESALKGKKVNKRQSANAQARANSSRLFRRGIKESTFGEATMPCAS